MAIMLVGMRAAIQAGWAVAAATRREIARQPLTLLLTTTAVVGCALMPLLTTHTLDEGEKIVADSVLALHLFLGLWLAGTSACHSLTRELQRGTAATVLSKPVGRGTFVVGKFAGVAGGMLMFSLTIAPATMMAARVMAVPFFWDWGGEVPLLLTAPVAWLLAAGWNYLTRRPFVADAGWFLTAAVWVAFWVGGGRPREGVAPTRVGEFYSVPMIGANVLIAIALLVLAAIALMFATRLDVVPTMALTGAVFLAGLMSDYLFGRLAATRRWAAAVYALVPNWQHFWMADAVNLGVPVPLRYVAMATAYAALYVSGVLAIGTWLLRSAEVKC
ncbi:MAG: ABC transporter permease subunit [Kiritimatiellae bacterium]|nr:ABC transporter permease subunit [Kiritimatiellia bacterium]